VVEKVFRIVSNSQEHLSPDIIAMALLKQITLNPKEPNVFFGVAEVVSPGENVIGQHLDNSALELEGEVS